MSLIDYNDFIKHYLDIPLEDINADYTCYFCGGKISHAYNNANIQVILCCSDCYYRMYVKNIRDKKTNKAVDELFEKGVGLEVANSDIIL